VSSAKVTGLLLVPAARVVEWNKTGPFSNAFPPLLPARPGQKKEQEKKIDMIKKKRSQKMIVDWA
jgi:hypothetical protein